MGELYGELSSGRAYLCGERVSRLRVGSLAAHASAALWASLSRGAPRVAGRGALCWLFADLCTQEFSII